MVWQGDRGETLDYQARDHGKKEVLELPCQERNRCKCESCGRQSQPYKNQGKEAPGATPMIGSSIEEMNKITQEYRKGKCVSHGEVWEWPSQ